MNYSKYKECGKFCEYFGYITFTYGEFPELFELFSEIKIENHWNPPSDSCFVKKPFDVTSIMINAKLNESCFDTKSKKIAYLQGVVEKFGYEHHDRFSIAFPNSRHQFERVLSFIRSCFCDERRRFFAINEKVTYPYLREIIIDKDYWRKIVDFDLESCPM